MTKKPKVVLTSLQHQLRNFRFSEEEEIMHETTSPYTPEHNALAKRSNRILQEGALTLQHDAELSNRFWVSGIHTTNFMKNWVLHQKIDMSPYEMFWGMKPQVNWLCIYGVKCWALVPAATWWKEQFKSIEGIFVGYYDNSKSLQGST